VKKLSRSTSSMQSTFSDVDVEETVEVSSKSVALSGNQRRST